MSLFREFSIFVYEVVKVVGSGLLGALCLMACVAAFLGLLWVAGMALIMTFTYPSISVPILAVILAIALLGRRYKNEDSL